MKLPEFDPTKEFETFHYPEEFFHINKINSSDANKYIEHMHKWYEELAQYTDSNGKAVHKVIQVYFKVPPMSAALKVIEIDVPKNFGWSPVAIIQPDDSKIVNLFRPIILWAINLNKHRTKVTVGGFSHKYLENPQEVFDWLNKKWNEKYPNNQTAQTVFSETDELSDVTKSF